MLFLSAGYPALILLVGGSRNLQPNCLVRFPCEGEIRSFPLQNLERVWEHLMVSQSQEVKPDIITFVLFFSSSRGSSRHFANPEPEVSNIIERTKFQSDFGGRIVHARLTVCSLYINLQL